MRSIARFGSDEPKRTWLPGMAGLVKIGAFALTEPEPEHGSDSVGLETSARRDGDSWVLDGAKRWIGNGTIADVVVVWARDTEDEQVKGFLVDRRTPGYRAQVMTGKGAVGAMRQADSELEQVRVAEADRLPGAQTFEDCAEVLAVTRSQCAWMALGHAVAGFDAALAYAQKREQFGKSLASFQLV